MAALVASMVAALATFSSSKALFYSANYSKIPSISSISARALVISPSNLVTSELC
jgi:hypothetical protein